MLLSRRTDLKFQNPLAAAPIFESCQVAWPSDSIGAPAHRISALGRRIGRADLISPATAPNHYTFQMEPVTEGEL